MAFYAIQKAVKLIKMMFKDLKYKYYMSSESEDSDSLIIGLDDYNFSDTSE